MTNYVPKLNQSQASFFGKLLRSKTDFTKTVRRQRDGGRDVQPQDVFCVDVTVVGGVAGGSGGNCTFTYSLKLRGDSEVLRTGVTPERPRMAGVQYATPAANSIGTAFFDDDGVLKLIEAIEEIPLTETCTGAAAASGDGDPIDEGIFGEVFGI
jgi:hypothetical protein